MPFFSRFPPLSFPYPQSLFAVRCSLSAVRCPLSAASPSLYPSLPSNSSRPAQVPVQAFAFGVSCFSCVNNEKREAQSTQKWHCQKKLLMSCPEPSLPRGGGPDAADANAGFSCLVQLASLCPPLPAILAGPPRFLAQIQIDPKQKHHLSVSLARLFAVAETPCPRRKRKKQKPEMSHLHISKQPLSDRHPAKKTKQKTQSKKLNKQEQQNRKAKQKQTKQTKQNKSKPKGCPCPPPVSKVKVGK